RRGGSHGGSHSSGLSLCSTQRWVPFGVPRVGGETRSWVHFPTILAGLLAIHPAWTVSAQIGDCGQLRTITSWIVMLLGVGTLTGQIVLGSRSGVVHRPIEHDTAEQALHPDGTAK